MRRDYFQRVWVGRPPWRGQGRAPHPASKECHSPRSRVAPALVRVLRRHVLAGGTPPDPSRSHARVARGGFCVVPDGGDPGPAPPPPHPPPPATPHPPSPAT